MIKLRYIRDRFNPVSFKLDFSDAAAATSAAIDKVTSIIQSEKDRAAGQDNVDKTNEMNYKIAKENNDLQYLMFNEANEFNAFQAELNRYFNERMADESRDFNAVQAQLDRDFQSQEAQKSRDWNSVEAQMKRAKGIGINPALVAGSMAGAITPATAGGAAATSVPASGSAAMASSLPHLATPTMQNSLPLYQTTLATQAEMGKMFSEIQRNVAEAQKTKSETKTNDTYNEFQREILSRGLKLSDVQISNLYAQTTQANEYVQQIRATVDQLKATTALTDQETVIKKVEAFYKSDECQAMIDKLKSETRWNDQQVEYYKALLPVQLGLYTSEIELNKANASLASMQSKLTGEEIESVRANVQLIKANTKNATLDYIINRTYGMKNAREEYYQNKALTDQMEYQANDVVQVLGTTLQVVNGVANAASSGAQVGAAAKYIKGAKPAKIKGFTQ